MSITSVDVFKSLIAETVLLSFTREVTIDGRTEEVHEYARMNEENASVLAEALGKAARKDHRQGPGGTGDE